MDPAGNEFRCGGIGSGRNLGKRLWPLAPEEEAPGFRKADNHRALDIAIGQRGDHERGCQSHSVQDDIVERAGVPGLEDRREEGQFGQLREAEPRWTPTPEPTLVAARPRPAAILPLMDRRTSEGHVLELPNHRTERWELGGVQLTSGLRGWHLAARPLPDGFASPSATVVDATARVDGERWRASLNVDNLLGAEWWDGTFVYPSNWTGRAGSSELPVRHITAGAARSIRLSVGWRFR